MSAQQVVDEDREDGERTKIAEQKDYHPAQKTWRGPKLVVNRGTVYYPANEYRDKHASKRQEYVAGHIIEDVENRHP